MHSRIPGALTFFPGICVRLAFLNLSKFLPVSEPQAYTACRISSVGMLTMNSPDSSMSLWLCRPGATLIAINGGFADVGIAHARVVMFGFASLPLHEIITVCMGWRSRVADVTFIGIFADILFTLFELTFVGNWSLFIFSCLS